MEKQAVIDFLVNTQNALKQIDKFKSKINRAADSIKGSLTGKLGAIGTAFLGLSSIKQVYDRTLQLSNIAQTFDLPIEKVSLFANQLSMFGGSSEEAAEAITNLEQAIVDLRTTGGGALRDVAAQVGISLYNSRGEIMSSMEIIDQLRVRFRGLNKDAQVKVAQQLGLGSPAALRLLRASDEEYKKLTEDAKKFGLINKETQDRVIKMQRTFAMLSQSFTALGASLIDTFSPLFDALTSAMNWLANQSSVVKGIVVGLVATLGLISPIISVVGGLATAFKLVGAAIKAVNIAIAMNPLGLLFVTLASAAVLLIEHWDTVQEYFKKFGSAVIDIFSKLGDYLIAPFMAVKDFIAGSVDFIMRLIEKPLKMIGNLVSKIPFIGDLFDDKKKREGDSALSSPNNINLNTEPSTPSHPIKNINNNDNHRVQVIYNVAFNGSYNGAEVERAMQNVIRQNSGGIRC